MAALCAVWLLACCLRAFARRALGTRAAHQQQTSKSAAIRAKGKSEKNIKYLIESNVLNIKNPKHKIKNSPYPMCQILKIHKIFIFQHPKFAHVNIFSNLCPTSNVKLIQKIMAKGNLFLGMGRGKVGDVVFYRMNGQQMARVRNRVPKNPRTNEQLYQRAVIATIMKAYSAGKEIFDHSFQGYTIGEGCMRRFNSVNARILRAALFDDINGNKPVEQQRGRFVAPRSLCATPVIGLQVSEGTLNNTLFEPRYTGSLASYYTPKADTTNVKEYLDLMGVSAGDIFTFVFFAADYDYIVYRDPFTDDNLATQYQTKFGWMRFIVKDVDMSAMVLNTATYGDIFQIEAGGELTLRFGVNTPFNKDTKFPIELGVESYGACMACIRSRNDIDLRSTEYLLPYNDIDFGLASGYVLNAWSDDVLKVGESELILEGGDAGSAVSGGTQGEDGGGPSGEPWGGYIAQSEQVITNSAKNMKGSRKTARHKGTTNETE